MPLREGDELVEFENVTVVDRRAPEAREKSVICRLANGDEHPIPRSQVEDGFLFPGDPGSNVEEHETFDVAVAKWMVDQWDAGWVKIQGVKVVRENDGQYGPSIQVLDAAGKKTWVNLRNVAADSPVRVMGDAGEIWVNDWQAEKAGWGRNTPGGKNAPQGAAPAARRHVGTDARKGKVDEGAVPENEAPEEDSVPF